MWASIGVGGQRVTLSAPAKQWTLWPYFVQRLLPERWLAALKTSSGQDAPGSEPSGERARTAEEHGDFEWLFAQHAQALLDYLYGMTRNHETATDLVQETFLRAYAATTPLGAIQRPKAWLYRIATNLALNESRRQRHFIWLPLQTMEPPSGAGSSDRWRVPPSGAMTGVMSLAPGRDDMATTVVERDAIWETLAALTPRQQAVLLLQTTAGFETRDICALLGLSEANARKILFRAKERFRAVYHALESEQGGGV